MKLLHRVFGVLDGAETGVVLTLACGSAAAIVVDSGIAIHIDSGKTFRFDYRGP